MARKPKPAFYAVAVGRRPGIYKTWPECEAQTTGFAGSKHKSFMTQEEAVRYIKQYCGDSFHPQVESGDYKSGTSENTLRPALIASAETTRAGSYLRRRHSSRKVPQDNDADGVETTPFEDLRCWYEQSVEESPVSPAATSPKRGIEESSVDAMRRKKVKMDTLELDTVAHGSALDIRKPDGGQLRTIEVYTDGAASGNGKASSAAGWGVYWPGSGDPNSDTHLLNESERLPGKLQTNNRAELMAIIRAVQLCPDPDAKLIIYTDSQYCIKAINEWQKNWRKRGWVTSKNEPVFNKDLIRLLERELRSRLVRPNLVYVKGHSTSEGNQQADRLAVEGAAKPAVPSHLWRDLEPSDSEEDDPKKMQHDAIQMWKKAGFTLEQAKARARGPTS